jgi:hypothetical protein
MKITMITVAEILDAVLPLTKEDNKCGFQKAKKLRARSDLIMLIEDYRQGKPVILPEEVLMLLNEL